MQVGRRVIRDNDFAASAHPRLHESPQSAVLFGKLSSGEWGRLIEGAGLALQKRQVLERVEDEVAAFLGPAVPRYHLCAATYDGLTGVSPHQPVPMSIWDGHRVVVAAVAHQDSELTRLARLSLAS